VVLKTRVNVLWRSLLTKRTKRSRRTVNLHDGTIELLLEYKQQSAMAGDFIFQNLNSKPLECEKKKVSLV